jgi:hypothetical protein
LASQAKGRGFEARRPLSLYPWNGAVCVCSKMLRAERATFAGNGLALFRLLIAAFKPKVPRFPALRDRLCGRVGHGRYVAGHGARSRAAGGWPRAGVFDGRPRTVAAERRAGRGSSGSAAVGERAGPQRGRRAAHTAEPVSRAGYLPLAERERDPGLGEAKLRPFLDGAGAVVDHDSGSLGGRVARSRRERRKIHRRPICRAGRAPRRASS